jgi:hypothetical protein
VKYVEIVRQSGKEGKKKWEKVHRHAEWPQVADAVIDARSPLAKTPTP